MELSNETDFQRILELEENYIKEICDNIIELKPTLIFTEKGISDLAQHFLAKGKIIKYSEKKNWSPKKRIETIKKYEKTRNENLKN